MQNIGVSDITMKVADQAPELSLSFKEKIELAKLLDRLNISVIEVDTPATSRTIQTTARTTMARLDIQRLLTFPSYDRDPDPRHRPKTRAIKDIRQAGG